ncbi:MAG: hypothetical protein HKO66_12000 [Saprospiraceae bacterium]|nr:hypothetical protein [Bacteroidia bacterium]NNL92952.1 hypothetical protein [Saprospiraceae bacterium]
MENKNHYLEITASRESATSLASPIGGFMDGRINESMTDTLHVKLIDKKKDVILLDDEGRNAGVEVAGDIQQIII